MSFNMALSLCSNWDSSSSLQTLMMNAEILDYNPSEYLSDFDYHDFSLSDYTSIDPLFETNINHSLVNPNFHNVPAETTIFPPGEEEELDPCWYPTKRQKMLENECRLPGTNTEISNGFVNLNPMSSVAAELLPELMPQNKGNNNLDKELMMMSTEVMKKPSSCSGTNVVSAQSIAARERRRKITEKTQQLGKLIPGGTKMSTAEMFQAASKYIKFLQAQVALLQLLGSVQEIKEGTGALHMRELKVLASPVVQEKLYSEEKCLVPKEFVQILARDHDFRSKHLCNKDNTNQFIMSNEIYNG